MNKMKLSNPVAIPKNYRETVLAFLRQYFDDEIWRLRNQFGIELATDDLPSNDDDYLQLLIAESCELIARVANGDTRGLEQSEIYEHVQGLVEKLFSVPGEAEYDIPRKFWLTDFGNIVLLAWVWSMGDELITTTEAVALKRNSTPDYYRNLAARNVLTVYVDKREPNPRRQTRFLKSQVLALPPVRKKRAAR